MRTSETINYAGLDLCVYGVWFADAGVFECDRVETETGLENLYPLLSEAVIDDLNQSVTSKINWSISERAIHGDPDAWKYDRQAA
jgi:hypothetical protein